MLSLVCRYRSGKGGFLEKKLEFIVLADRYKRLGACRVFCRRHFHRAAGATIAAMAVSVAGMFACYMYFRMNSDNENFAKFVTALIPVNVATSTIALAITSKVAATFEMIVSAASIILAGLFITSCVLSASMNKELAIRTFFVRLGLQACLLYTIATGWVKGLDPVVWAPMVAVLAFTIFLLGVARIVKRRRILERERCRMRQEELRSRIGNLHSCMRYRIASPDPDLAIAAEAELEAVEIKLTQLDEKLAPKTISLK
jgi:FtsH-binding integral membrane protein